MLSKHSCSSSAVTHHVLALTHMHTHNTHTTAQVFLLRGNHELRDVNGWEDHYGEKSFLWQCKARFGADIGVRIWEEVNQVTK
jgi:hypothetical protein